MRNSSFGRYAAVAIAAAALAGCGGHGIVPQTGAPAPPAVDRGTSGSALPGYIEDAGKLSGEMFKKTADASAACNGKSKDFTFSAKGKAMGPYSGKYTVSGSTSGPIGHKTLKETFQIKSGSKTFSGTATAHAKHIAEGCFKEHVAVLDVSSATYTFESSHGTTDLMAGTSGGLGSRPYSSFEQTFSK